MEPLIQLCRATAVRSFLWRMTTHEAIAMIKDLFILALVGAAAWLAYSHFEDRIKQFLGFAPPAAVRILPEQFVCDGRIYCTQMTSCEEATFFLRNCPRQRMDPDGEGIACKVQWCK